MMKVVFAGLPASGKSTFLAALCHQILNGRAATVFTLDHFSDQEDRLRALEARWLEANVADRTKTNTETWVTLHASRVSTGEALSFEIPDLRGELFEQPAAKATCDARLWDALQEAEGLVLFTNGGRRRDDIGIDEISAAMRFMAEDDEAEAEADAVEDDEAEADGADAVESSAAFDPQRMPEEAMLVELLQTINRGRWPQPHRRIALVVSAWDVCDQALPPAQWFAQERPMLDQFLAANDQAWECQIYGVSAQGGKLPEDAERLKKMRHPAERVRVVLGEDPPSYDLTAILDWVSVRADD